MTLTQPKANYGLSAQASPSSNKVSGDVTVGSLSTKINLTGADVIYTVKCVIANVGGAFIIGPDDGDTSGSTSFSAGTQQVETATAAGTVTTAGNATVTVTAAGMTGSPKAISVPVLLSDDANAIALAIRTSLAADTDVSVLFTISGATDAIILTRDKNLGVAFANDATLNVAIIDGTSAGVTTAATSADTTAGVASTGTIIEDGDGKDFEGITLPTIVTLQGVQIDCTAGAIDQTSTNEDASYAVGERRVVANASGIASWLSDLTFTASAIQSEISITIIGKTT